jgi:hypothetical protein
MPSILVALPIDHASLILGKIFKNKIDVKFKFNTIASA